MFNNIQVQLQPGLNLSGREKALLRVVPAVCFRYPQARFCDLLHEVEHAGISPEQIKEVLIQLTIYAGFPKVLEAMKKFTATFGRRGNFSDEPPQSETFNFFRQREVKNALNDIDPDFAYYALLNAVSLCDRPGLHPKERALIILASDVCNGVFEGPFQIHLKMAMQSDATSSQIYEVVDTLLASQESRTSAIVAHSILEQEFSCVNSY